MKKQALGLSVAALVLGAALAGRAEVTAGFDFFVDAGQDTDGDRYWEDLTAGNPTGFDLLLDDSPLVNRVAVSGSSTSFTHAYDFPGGSTANEAGALPVNRGTAGMRSFQEAGDGDWSTQDLTLEIWLKPDTLTPSAANGMIIFEDGGGTGLGILVDDGELVVTHDGAQNQIRYNLSTDALGVLTAAATNEFMQVVVTHDTGSPYQTVLYINGQQISTSNNNNDWSGGDAAGFGTKGDNNVGGLGSGNQNTETFDGQMAVIRGYRDQILTPTEVLANFDELSGPDTIPPEIDSLSPTNNATGVYPGANLVATFNEGIALTGGGTLTIKNLDAATQVDIALPDAQVTVSGADLTINPTNDLNFATNYAVRISGDAIEDLADTPNAFAGITNDTTWRFTITTYDETAPVITDTNPADDATGVTPNANLVATFDDDIAVGSGNITITNLTEGTTPATIAVTDVAQVSIAGNVLTIDPDILLSGASELAVLIDAGAVENYSGVGFGGIADTGTWSFTVIDTTTISGTAGGNNSWNTTANWDCGVPSGSLNAVIGSGVAAKVDGGTAPAYAGNLTLQNNATLQVGWANPRHAEDFNALGTPGTTTIFMQDASSILLRAGDHAGVRTIPAIELEGDARITLNTSTEPSENFEFAFGIRGPHSMTLKGKGNQDALLTASNSFSELILTSTEGSYDVFANAEFSLNGNVTVEGYNGGPAADLTIAASNAMADSATLALNGSTAGTLLTMNADDTVGQLTVNSFSFPTGTYGRVGIPATVDHEQDWIAGDGVLTVSSAPADSTPPVLVDITSDSGNGVYYFVLEPVTYTLTFDEAVTSSVTVADFENAGSAPLTVDSVTQTAVNEFQVVVTAGSTGTLTLRIKSSAAFDDLFGNTLTGPITDDETETVTVRPPDPLIYEPFDYDTGNINGKNGGTGWGGAWVTRRGAPPVTALNNFWGLLPTKGRRMNSQAWSICYRPIGTTLHAAGLMRHGATLWFSFVADWLNQNMTNLDYNFALCNNNFVNDYPVKVELLDGGQGVGIGNFRTDFMAAYWKESGDGDTHGDRTTSNSKLVVNNSDRSRVLFVGKIEWGADTNAAETITLYAPGHDRELPAPFVDAWETEAVDQSLFDRVSIQWKDSNPSIDEIRFGATYDEVVGIHHPDTGMVLMVK